MRRGEHLARGGNRRSVFQTAGYRARTRVPWPPMLQLVFLKLGNDERETRNQISKKKRKAKPELEQIKKTSVPETRNTGESIHCLDETDIIQVNFV